MKELFQKLSNVFSFFKENCLINQQPTEVVDFKESEESVIEGKSKAPDSAEQVAGEKETGRRLVGKRLGLLGKKPLGLRQKTLFSGVDLGKDLLGGSSAGLGNLASNIGRTKKEAEEPPQTRGEVTQPQATPREISQPERIVERQAVESVPLEQQLAELVKTMDVDVVVNKKNRVNFLVDFSKIPKEKVQALSNAISNNDIGVLRKQVGTKAIQKIYKNLLAMKLLEMDREYDRFTEEVADRTEDIRQAGSDIDIDTGQEKTPKQKRQEAKAAKKALLAAITNPTKRIAVAGLTEEF